MTTKSKSPSEKGCKTQLWVVAIPAIATVIVALISAPWWIGVLDQSQDRQPPEVTITAFEDENGDDVNKDDAPFKVFVRLTTSNAKGKYLYLVVDDSHGLWIQPELGKVGEVSDYTGYCYLGWENDADSLNKTYRIFAVITNTEYDERDRLDISTILASSDTIEMFRTR